MKIHYLTKILINVPATCGTPTNTPSTWKEKHHKLFVQGNTKYRKQAKQLIIYEALTIISLDHCANKDNYDCFSLAKFFNSCTIKVSGSLAPQVYHELIPTAQIDKRVQSTVKQNLSKEK